MIGSGDLVSAPRPVHLRSETASAPRTTARATRRPLEALYPPGETPASYQRGVIDDTLDAHPPYHLLRGQPTAEDVEVAKQLAAEYGYSLPEIPPARPEERTAPLRAAPDGRARPRRPKQITSRTKK